MSFNTSAAIRKVAIDDDCSRRATRRARGRVRATSTGATSRPPQTSNDDDVIVMPTSNTYAAPETARNAGANTLRSAIVELRICVIVIGRLPGSRRSVLFGAW